MMEGLLDVIRREVHRVLARHTRETAGTVIGYDPKTHAVKVKMMPEGVDTGWLPIRTLQTGNGYGLFMAPEIGQPLSLAFHEDDREAGTIMGAFFTDVHKPVPIKSGEFLYRHKLLAELYFLEDGTVHLKGKGGDTAVLEFKPDGTVSLRNSAAEIGITPGGDVFVKGSRVYLGGDVGDGSLVVTVAGPSANVYAKV